MVLAVMQVSSSHCESQCSSLIGAVQFSGARGWMSNVMLHMQSQTGGFYGPLVMPHSLPMKRYLKLFCPRRRTGETRNYVRRKQFAIITAQEHISVFVFYS